MFYEDDAKRFLLTSLPLCFSDLKQRTMDAAWSEHLPAQFNYYHMEDEIAITIDD